MFNIKPLLVVLAATVGFAASNSYAGSGSALQACKAEISAKYAESTVKFRNNPATSKRGGKYTFWLNAVARVDGERQALKTKCVTTKEYEILSLDIENGSWR